MGRIFSLFLLLHMISTCGFAQGLVLKHVHSSTTYQQGFYALGEITNYRSEAWLSNLVSHYNAWDFDGDGYQDFLAQERQVGSGNSWSLKVYSSVSFTLLWSSEGEIPDETTWEAPLFFDFTGDGQKEVAYCNTGSNGIGTFNIYSPALHTCILSTTPGECQYLILDFDSDGVLDIGLHSSIAPEEFRIEIWGAGQVTSSPPTDLVIHSEGSDLVLHWVAVDSCSLYDIQWGFALDGEYASVGTSCTTSFMHSGAAIAPRAYYRVAAITSTLGHEVIGQAVYTAAKDR